MVFKVEGEARLAFTNVPGSVPDVPDNGELKVQQADGRLVSRKADGTVRITPLDLGTAAVKNVEDLPVSTAQAAALMSLLQTKMEARYVINVRLFGVKGDGTPEDMTKVKAAIDAAQTLAALILAQTDINTYFRGGVVLYWPAGVYSLSGEIVITSARVSVYGDGFHRTTFVKTSDYGDTLRITDPHSSQNTGGNSVCGIGFLATVSTTGGAHLRLVRTGFGNHSDLWMQNGFEGLVLDGVVQSDFNNIQVKSTASVLGSFKSGSSFVRLKHNNASANSNVRFRGLTATADENVRYIENGILIEDADVVHFSDVEVAGVLDTELLLLASGSASIQGVRTRNFNFDNYAKYGVRISGTTSGAVQKIDIEGAFFDHDINHVLINSPQAVAVRIAIEGTGVGHEGIVVAAGLFGPVAIERPMLRGVGTAATANRQYSAIVIGSNYATVTQASVFHANFDLKYGVELLDNVVGSTVVGATGLVGASGLGIVRLNNSMSSNSVVGVPTQGADGCPGTGTA